MHSRILVVWLAAWLGALAGARGAEVCVARVNGPIGPATAVYLKRALGEAGRLPAQCLVVELDTPGGLLETTKEIVQEFYRAPVPVVVYVAPAGASAGSAGCFITLAADVAAMAPHTSIGAAHPVELGGGLMGGGDDKGGDVMKQKLENYATSFIESIATKHQRNVAWAKSSVQESAAITSEKALELKVIEIIAADRSDLLRQLDGRVAQGKTLQTQGASVREIPMVLRENVFRVLWRPETMFVLMLVAIYGIIGELSNPGAILPGVAGAIALVLVLYMGAILPINYAGLALLLLAFALFIIDVFAPSHGVLTGGGIIAFLLGALMLFDRSDPAFRLSLGLILPATVLTAAFFLWVVGSGLRAQFQPPRTGAATMVGQVVEVSESISPAGGRVWIEGESWRAVSDLPIPAGNKVRVTAMRGLTLSVTQLDNTV